VSRRVLTASAVARVVGVHRTTILRWWARGILPSARVAGAARMTAAQLDAWYRDTFDARRTSDASQLERGDGTVDARRNVCIPSHRVASHRPRP
jgi:excisionase family DNA binding protein